VFVEKNRSVTPVAVMVVVVMGGGW